MLCPGCGNEIEQDDPCLICKDRERRRDIPAPEAPEQPAWEETRARERLTLCTRCGNEMRPDTECEVCAVRADDVAVEENVRFCSGCGNVVYGNGDCPVCVAGRGAHSRAKLTMCPGCGNEVEDIHQCPVCMDGRASGRAPTDDRGPLCPSCDEPLEPQEWDGVQVLMCPSCQGCLFPPDGLETTLNKLRDTREAADLHGLVEDFRKRLHSTLPGKKVRYTLCPQCGLSMTRRAYKRVSGIILDVCGKHGVWTDQSTFGELTNFIIRGGDTFAADKRG